MAICSISCALEGGGIASILARMPRLGRRGTSVDPVDIRSGATACWAIHACIAIAAAAPALIERVEPNCAMCRTSTAAARAASDSPTDSCPNSSTHARGSG